MVTNGHGRSLGSHRCGLSCRPDRHVTVGFESRHAGGRSWFSMVGARAVVEGVHVLVVAVDHAPEVRPPGWDPSATPLRVSWRPI